MIDGLPLWLPNSRGTQVPWQRNLPNQSLQTKMERLHQELLFADNHLIKKPIRIAIELPTDPELVDQHAEARRPRRID
ncbi:hypothetical protein [Paenibacillus cymbidii]|uniref:hypothetical protein n=1 Tax=Paenibacillus cymbidii TaxID=1639034 RepID=UPI0014367E08